MCFWYLVHEIKVDLRVSFFFDSAFTFVSHSPYICEFFCCFHPALWILRKEPWPVTGFWIPCFLLAPRIAQSSCRSIRWEGLGPDESPCSPTALSPHPKRSDGAIVAGSGPFLPSTFGELSPSHPPHSPPPCTLALICERALTFLLFLWISLEVLHSCSLSSSRRCRPCLWVPLGLLWVSLP